MSANCVAFTSCSLFSRSSSHYFPHALIEGGCIGRSTFREPLLPRSSALKPYRELRRPLSNRIVLRRPLHARLNTPPRLHQTPPLNPHANRETYSGHTSVHERAGIKRNTGRAPPVRPQFKRGQTPAKLLPSALYLHEARQTAGKNRTPPPLPHLLLHHFLHSSDGFRGAVLRHITRLGGPPSPPDTGEAARCFTNLAWPDGASCRPKQARGSTTRHSSSAR
jgi:hypothetical protein